MANWRKLTTSRSELLLGIYGHGPTNGDSPEFGEDEVWSVFNHVNELPSHNSLYSCNSPKRVESGLTLVFEEHHKTKTIVHKLVSPRGGRQVVASAPVNVPDWSKTYRGYSVELLGELSVYEEDHDDFEDELVPPHEYLAHEYARIRANSVFEGVGRTLKGRDMSRVRDSVWGQTGFDG